MSAGRTWWRRGAVISVATATLLATWPLSPAWAIPVTGKVWAPSTLTLDSGTVQFSPTGTGASASADVSSTGEAHEGGNYHAFSTEADAGAYRLRLSAFLPDASGPASTTVSMTRPHEIEDPAPWLPITLPLTPAPVRIADTSNVPVPSRAVELWCKSTVGTAPSEWASTSRGETDSAGRVRLHGLRSSGQSSGHCRLDVSMGDGEPPLRRMIDQQDLGGIDIRVPDSKVQLSGAVDWPYVPLLEPDSFVDVRMVDSTPIGQALISAEGSWALAVWPGTYEVTTYAETPKFPDPRPGEDSFITAERGVFEQDEVEVPDTGAEIDLGVEFTPMTLHVVDGNGDGVSGFLQAACRDTEDGSGSDMSANRVLEPGQPVEIAGLATTDPWTCWITGHDGQSSYAATEWFVVDPTSTVWTWNTSTGSLTEGAPPAADSDGVPDAVEDGAPGGGDGNGDGTPDSEQANVTSLPANGAAPGGGDPYVTIASAAGTTLTDVSTLDPEELPDPPAGVTLPSGLASFVVEGVDEGADATVSLHLDSTAGVNGYAKYHDGAWLVLPTDRVDVVGNRVDIRLTDGGVGDDDGLPNGRIVDPGGVAQLVPSDTEAPTVTGASTTTPNAAGWYRSNVRVQWTATDPSGVVANPADSIVSTQGANVSVTSGEACDLVTPTPNCGTGTLSGLKIDKTAPWLSVTGVSNGATYTLGNVPQAGCAAGDALSGLAGPCRGVKTGGNSAGVGSFAYTARAWDKAANLRVVTEVWKVVYRFSGFVAPLNDPSVTPGAPTSIFKAGSTVPVAFSLKKANGQVATPASKPVWVAPVKGARTNAAVNEAVSNAPGTAGSSFVWRNNRWEFNWSTRGLAAGHLYRIGVKLDDGTTKHLTVGLR